MDFFEKIGKKATETFNSAAEKTNKIASETKIKIKINDCKSKIKDLYQDIGKVVYQKLVLDGKLEVKEDIEEQLSKISELTNQIEEFEKQIIELSDMKQCVNCKNKIEKKAKFCPECGAEQPEEVVHEVEVVSEDKNEENQENEINPENNSEEVAEDTEETVEEIVEEKKEDKNE